MARVTLVSPARCSTRTATRSSAQAASGTTIVSNNQRERSSANMTVSCPVAARSNAGPSESDRVGPAPRGTGDLEVGERDELVDGDRELALEERIGLGERAER